MTEYNPLLGPLRIPTCHLNGSPKTHLLEAYLAAHNAVLAAIDALTKQTWPHGRDYYVQPEWPGDKLPSNPAIHLALRQHESRLERLQSVRAELEEIVLGIDAQEGRR